MNYEQNNFRYDMCIISNVKYLHIKYDVITVATFGFGFFLAHVVFFSPLGLNN